jgi:hypothetical protein
MLIFADKMASAFEIGLARIRFRRRPFVISHVSVGSIKAVLWATWTGIA